MDESPVISKARSVKTHIQVLFVKELRLKSFLNHQMREMTQKACKWEPLDLSRVSDFQPRVGSSQKREAAPRHHRRCGSLAAVAVFPGSHLANRNDDGHAQAIRRLGWTINPGAERDKRKDKPIDNWELTTKRWVQPRSEIQIPTDVSELAYSAENRSGRHLSSTPEGSTIFLALEGEPMSQECPTSNPNSERPGGFTHVLPSTLQPPRFPTEEASTVPPTPNRYWRLFNDPGLTPPAPGLTPLPLNLEPPIVTTEAFLGLTQQVQTLTGMIQAIIPYVPQLAQALAHQRPDVPRQTLQQEVPQSRPTQEEHPDNGAPHHPPIEATTENPNTSVSQPASRSRNIMRTPPKPDIVFLDSTNSVREQLRQVNQRLDEVQRDFVRYKEKVGETTKGRSPLVLEIQDKPVPSDFWLPTLEPYDGSTDPSEHVATFRAQMALYNTSDALMCRAFSTTLRGPARMWYSRLKSSSIPSFDHFAKEFELNFMASSRPRLTTASLLDLMQGSDEPLAQFVSRFTAEVQRMPDTHPSMAIQAFSMGLRPSQFF
ncbi:hypothetical protein BHE74_00010297 [Ensete ventricosum]|nr:hypothetical protein BHE74_00010297 [Ensete ventricosum]